MADTKWTKEQERAISDRGKGIIVSAAAGSGKTTVLIERMIQLLSDEKNKIPADRLLAVTFTKEAASSMKEKLSRAFDEQLRRDPENKWLLSQQNLIQLARISTINSFCLDLALPLPPCLAALSSTLQKTCFMRSLSATMGGISSSGPL